LIDKAEIMDFSREFGLRANVVEKDYVLGWVLAGIFNHPVIGSSWVFKGGTCLKKCFLKPTAFPKIWTLPFPKPIIWIRNSSFHVLRRKYSCMKVKYPASAGSQPVPHLHRIACLQSGQHSGASAKILKY